MSPAWSADGRRLIVVQIDQQTPQLNIYNYDGTGKKLAPPPDEEAK
jgi:Tol biopolymer transport system component